MTLHNRFMDDIIFVPSNSSTSFSSKKKKSREISRGRIYPRNHSTSARFFDLISFQFVRVISLDGSAWFKLRQLVVTRPKEEASYKKKKKKDRCVHFWNLEKTLLEIYVHREIQIAVKLHLYMNEILISDLFEP